MGNQSSVLTKLDRAREENLASALLLHPEQTWVAKTLSELRRIMKSRSEDFQDSVVIKPYHSRFGSAEPVTIKRETEADRIIAL
jgi:hypothetical protein